MLSVRGRNLGDIPFTFMWNSWQTALGLGSGMGSPQVLLAMRPDSGGVCVFVGELGWSLLVLVCVMIGVIVCVLS